MTTTTVNWASYEVGDLQGRRCGALRLVPGRVSTNFGRRRAIGPAPKHSESKNESKHV
jgi:hypothetical protein